MVSIFDLSLNGTPIIPNVIGTNLTNSAIIHRLALMERAREDDPKKTELERLYHFKPVEDKFVLRLHNGTSITCDTPNKIEGGIDMGIPAFRKASLIAKNIEVLPDDNNPMAVVVTFEDGDVQRAAVSGGDSFDLETGITICIAKHALYYITGKGSSTLNNTVKKALKLYQKSKKDKLEAELLAEQRATKAKRKHDKRVTKRKAAEQAAREREIEIRKEAYVRALKEIGYVSPFNPDALKESK